MLALRSWSAYELTQQMRRSLAYCWSRPESVLYQEPKRLVRLGLATEPGPPRLEVEAMLRLLYADRGGKDDLLESVRALRAWALGRTPEALSQVRGYLTDAGPFPQRLHIIALFARFYLDLFEQVVRWTNLAEAEIQAWPRTADLGMTGPTRTLLEEMLPRLEALATRAKAPESGRELPPPD
jgi:hypothetical protein